jgi:tetratricopeptide (TPR) repeat protein
MGQEGQFVESVPAAAVRAQLARILESPAFLRAQRLRRFLAHCIETSLAGRAEELKEYSLGVDVFDRGEGFDPKADPIVRVDARRLRKALADYYAGQGAGDPVEIVLPTGSYVPAFRMRPQRRADARWSRAFNQEAYELYLRGRRRLNATRPEKMAEALSLLEGAVARDPAFAEALGAIADAHFVTAVFGLAPPAEALAGARRAAEAALAIDPDLGAAHAQMGRVSAVLDRDFAAAQAAFDRAIALDPHAPAVRQARAMWLLAPLGRLGEALAELEPLLDQKPYSRRLRVDCARLLAFQGRFDEAIRHLELILEFEPDFAGAPWALAMAYEHAGRKAEAQAMHERQVRQFSDAYPLVDRWLEAAQAIWGGEPDRARPLVAEMDRTARSTPVSASVLTDAWLRLGEADRALDWLERAADRHMLRVVHLAVDPDYAVLRGHPRFERLLRRLGLPAR